jgi:hypothetical protein
MALMPESIVRGLREGLGDDLVAVVLFGSRARPDLAPGGAAGPRLVPGVGGDLITGREQTAYSGRQP